MYFKWVYIVFILYVVRVLLFFIMRYVGLFFNFCVRVLFLVVWVFNYLDMVMLFLSVFLVFMFKLLLLEFGGMRK